jgi:hypothetical protein
MLWNDKVPTYALKEALNWMFKIRYFIDTNECLSSEHDGGRMASLKSFIVKVPQVVHCSHLSSPSWFHVKFTFSSWYRTLKTHGTKGEMRGSIPMFPKQNTSLPTPLLGLKLCFIILLGL